MLAEGESPASLARCLRLYLEEPGYHAGCARRAGEYGAQMSWRAVGARYAALFHDLAGTSRLVARAAVGPAGLPGSGGEVGGGLWTAPRSPHAWHRHGSASTPSVRSSAASMAKNSSELAATYIMSPGSHMIRPPKR